MTIEIAWTTVSSLCNYSVARLSLSSGQSRNRIQDTCCRHTRSWSTSLCECCVVARIVTNNIASEYKFTFVLFWNVLFHFIFQMNLHPWALAKCARFPSFIAWRIKSDLLCLPLFHHMLGAFWVFPILCPLQLLFQGSSLLGVLESACEPDCNES